MYTELEFNVLCDNLLFSKEDIIRHIDENMSYCNGHDNNRDYDMYKKLLDVVNAREIETITPDINNEDFVGYIVIIEPGYICLTKARVDEVKFGYDNDMHEVVADYIAFENFDEDIVWSSLFLNMS